MMISFTVECIDPKIDRRNSLLFEVSRALYKFRDVMPRTWTWHTITDELNDRLHCPKWLALIVRAFQGPRCPPFPMPGPQFAVKRLSMALGFEFTIRYRNHDEVNEAARLLLHVTQELLSECHARGLMRLHNECPPEHGYSECPLTIDHPFRNQRCMIVPRDTSVAAQSMVAVDTEPTKASPAKAPEDETSLLFQLSEQVCELRDAMPYSWTWKMFMRELHSRLHCPRWLALIKVAAEAHWFEDPKSNPDWTHLQSFLLNLAAFMGCELCHTDKAHEAVSSISYLAFRLLRDLRDRGLVRLHDGHFTDHAPSECPLTIDHDDRNKFLASSGIRHRCCMIVPRDTPPVMVANTSAGVGAGADTVDSVASQVSDPGKRS